MKPKWVLIVLGLVLVGLLTFYFIALHPRLVSTYRPYWLSPGSVPTRTGQPQERLATQQPGALRPEQQPIPGAALRPTTPGRTLPPWEQVERPAMSEWIGMQQGETRPWARPQDMGARPPRMGMGARPTPPFGAPPSLPKPSGKRLLYTGQIMPEEIITVISRTSGTISQVFVKEGQRVRAGQQLCRLEDSQIRQRVLNARQQLETALANLRRLEASPHTEEEKSKTSESSLTLPSVPSSSPPSPSPPATPSGAASPPSLPETERSSQPSQPLAGHEQISPSSKEAGAMSPTYFRPPFEPRPFAPPTPANRKQALLQARHQVQNARMQLELAERELAQTIIQAPVSGVVQVIQVAESSGGIGTELSRHYGGPGGMPSVLGFPRVGRNVNPGMPLFSIIAENRCIVTFEVNEMDIPRVYVGQPAKVVPKAFPNVSLKGKVARIAIMGRRQGETVVFPVAVAVIGQLGRVRLGMTVKVELVE